ncbi:TetR/AcrR family transcriptional regulator [Microbacterium ulmi]|uniref:TetR/AcrR family transcriptional regulator n=1 Tax=Microbacterium ulmi TaxID=179095 RepID=A0A7Y2LZ48_9MICO|nr:TetR/AcrR family transcriptional regulator [Microbacterium ulmi]NII69633.1 TetR/AcrR family transcriptional repressor of nem operon [Microbacterium ulmi]NNH03479.1 TetR/AcrR family transcriptional regulator [Microbacterium ulmi]
MAAVVGTDTRERILDVAEELVQTRGLNAMSYADISARVGITKASLHYHFATKSDLVRTLIARYSTRFYDALATIETTTSDRGERLRRYAEIYATVLEGHRMCLCGMLASDYETLSAEAQSDVEQFFEHNIDWLARVIGEQAADGALAADVDPRAAAETIIAGLEGAMLVSRTMAGATRFRSIATGLLAGVTARD